MALARLALKNLNLGRRVPLVTSWRLSSTSAAEDEVGGGATLAAEDKTGGGGEVAVSKKDRGKKKGRGGSLWKKNSGDLSLHDLFPSSLGNALMQATNNINKLLNNFAPSRIIGRVKEKDDHYKIKFHLPGLRKDDLKITVADGMLRVVGESKEEETDSEDDEHGEVRRFYGYYDSTLVLPNDVKVDEIKADMKHGVLTVIIPKSDDLKKNVKEVEVN